MINGLDLFSGIGGLTVALSEYVRPIAYCEIEPYAAAVLFSRMLDGSIPTAPVFPDVTKLTAEVLPNIDIIYGGFPCQDISYAGRGAGLEGERSGLFFEIIRLASELRPSFVFLENVPAVTVRGLGRILSEWTTMGYDCRWTIMSAAAVGACHIRERWWFLAHSSENGRRELHSGKQKHWEECKGEADIEHDGKLGNAANPIGLRELQSERVEQKKRGWLSNAGGWPTEPAVCGADARIPHRVDRIKCLGNAVVPQCAKAAFERLIGVQGAGVA